MQYTSVALLADYLKLENHGDNSMLSLLIDMAGAWLDREARRILCTDTDTTVYIDAIGEHIQGKTLHVSDFGDLCEITSVTNGDDTTVTTAQYTTYPKTLSTREPTYRYIKLLDSNALSWTYTTDWENAIEIVGKWALFSADSVNEVPADIQHNTKLLAAFAYRQKDPGIFETIAIPSEGIIQSPRGFPTSAAYWVKRLRKP